MVAAALYYNTAVEESSRLLAEPLMNTKTAAPSTSSNMTQLSTTANNNNAKTANAPAPTSASAHLSALHAAPKTSPAVLALRKINEALQQKVVSPGQPDAAAAAAAAALNSEAIQESVRRAEQLKHNLMDALKQDQLAAIRAIIGDIERAQLCKEALEISRIGAVVNGLRKSVGESAPDLAKACRQLIKSWRQLAEASRPASSCGSSTNGTPSLVSPAPRRGVTPRAKQVTPGNARPIDGHQHTAGSAYAPERGQKRGADPSPPQAAHAKRQRVSPAATSVVAARQNVQSTEQLVASLGIDVNLSALAGPRPAPSPAHRHHVVPPACVAGPPPPAEKKPSKRGRKPKHPPVDATKPPQQPEQPHAPLKLKIRFGAQPSVDASGTSSAENHSPAHVASSSSASHNSSLSASPPSLAMSTEPIDLAPEPIPPEGQVAPAPVVHAKPKMSWYDKLVSVDELHRRAKELEAQKHELDAQTRTEKAIVEPTVLKHNKRQLVVMPYIELDDEPVDLFVGINTAELFML